MQRWKGRTNESLFWMLFGAGGMIAVVIMPVLIVVFGLVVPFGGLGGADGVYDRVHAVVGNPIGLILTLIILGLVLWHCCHRAYHGLHDLKVHPPEIVRVLVYGIAILTPVIALALANRCISCIISRSNGNTHSDERRLRY